jgi:electron transport complex protein RnfE
MFKEIVELFKQDVWKNNTILVQILGLCPTLAVTTTAVTALGLALTTTIVLTISNVTISMCRRIIIPEVRIPSYILIISTLVAVTEILMQTFMFTVYESMGIFISLIVTNCIIISHAEAYAMKHNPFMSLLDAMFVGIGYTMIMILVGSIREILGFGTVFQGLNKLFGEYFADKYLVVLPADKTLIIAILPPGAFITIGLIIALRNAISRS